MLKNMWLQPACRREYVTSCQISPFITKAGIRANHSSTQRRSTPNTRRSISSAKKIAVQVRMMRRTQPSKGGKLNEMLPPRLMTDSSSPFRFGDDGQAAVASGVESTDGEYLIILRKLEDCTRPARDRMAVPPVRGAGASPNDLVHARARRGIPRQRRGVFKLFREYLD